jgi:hypothetical protein
MLEFCYGCGFSEGRLRGRPGILEIVKSPEYLKRKGAGKSCGSKQERGMPLAVTGLQIKNF